MPVTIPVGGGTFTAVEGETYILSANTTGNITFTGDVSFNVIIDTDQTAGTNSINFGTGNDPTVTYAPGVDAADTTINADGDSLTVNIGDGATTGVMDAGGVTGAAGLDLNTGDNVTVSGGLLGPTGGVADVRFGDGATIDGNVDFSTSGATVFVARDDLSINGTLTGSNNADIINFGDNWIIDGNANARGGDDQLYLGVQGSTDMTIISGGTGNDGITVTEANALFRSDANSAGWQLNPDGTVSSQPFSSQLFDAGNTNHTYTSFEVDGPTAPICFTAGTQIEVAHGETVNVEDLSRGDMVMTADHGLQAVRWIGTKKIDAVGPATRDNLRPIRIAAGALGGGLPQKELLVSPQHRMLVRSKIARRMFDEDEVLVAAKHLLTLDGIDIADDVSEVTYVHFLCDTHEVVFANGAASESLYTGPQALKSVSPKAVSEIMAIFPELADIDYRPLSARHIVSGRLGRKLAMRHTKNKRPLLARRHEIAESNL